MPLVPAICTQCGAQIEVDNTHEAGICKHCGTAFITEKAINNYATYINNNFSIENINVGGADMENMYSAVQKAINAKDYSFASNLLKKMTESYPHDYRGWWGFVEIAYDGEIYNNSPNIQYPITWVRNMDAYKKAMMLADIEVAKKLTEICEKYENNYRKMVEAKDTVIAQKFSDLSALQTFFEKKKAVYHISEEVYYLTFTIYKKGNSLIISRVSSSYGSYYAKIQGIDKKGKLLLTNETEIKDEYRHGKRRNVEIPSSGKFGNIRICDYNQAENKIGITDYGISLGGMPKVVYLNIMDANTGCYVATCVYGSYDCPQVWTLRRFRDYTLDATWYGRAFIKCYYAISPTLVKWFGNQKWFKTFWKKQLDHMVSKLNQKGIDNTQYHDKY